MKLERKPNLQPKVWNFWQDFSRDSLDSTCFHRLSFPEKMVRSIK